MLLLLFSNLTDRERSFIHWFTYPKCLQQLGWAEARSWELNPDFPQGWQRPNDLIHPSFPPRAHISRAGSGHGAGTQTQALQHGIWLTQAASYLPHQTPAPNRNISY